MTRKRADKPTDVPAGRKAKATYEDNEQEEGYPYEGFLIESVLKPFYQKRFEDLQGLSLEDVLWRKNPYLFKAKNIEFPWDLVKGIVDAHLSSQEETFFGNLLEGYAVHISSRLFGGYKPPTAKGQKWVDLIFTRKGVTYIVEIKSGPNWANSSQVGALLNMFVEVRNRLREQGTEGEIIAVNGCMYGKDRRPLKKHPTDSQKNYYKLCGQDFWALISDDDQLYQKIILPLDKEARQKDEQFKSAYNAKIYEMTKAFMEKFMKDDQIDWSGLLDFVSKREAAAATAFVGAAQAVPEAATEIVDPEAAPKDDTPAEQP
ncbi:MAG TPA: PmeII family type II restriction endonuclease [Blastocatellia bacterium]|nr:PmeII family type II restriction endonuclease [Blastocatellia bacterium]